MARKFSPLSHRVIGLAIEVHRQLGPGLLESTYQQCLTHECQINQVSFQCEHPLPVVYKGIRLDCGYRIDLLIENQLIVEIKAVKELEGIHKAQLLTYMRLSGIKEGLLINFNVTKLTDGVRSFTLTH
ncbi:MAG: GxxExxY protein [Chloroflexota bacterium]